MISRLGNVLYWFGCAAAFAFATFGLWVVSEGGLPSPGTAIVATLTFAGLIWLAGRACRYVLSNQ